MQVFVPYDNFKKSIESLDYKRKGKQRVEAYQVIQTILKIQEGVNKGAWINHPVVKMWLGHEYQLAIYGLVCCHSWVSMGYKDTLTEKFNVFLNQFVLENRNRNLPKWWGDSKVHTSHQSNLIRKLPDFYGPQFVGVPNDLPYYWAEDSWVI